METPSGLPVGILRLHDSYLLIDLLYADRKIGVMAQDLRCLSMISGVLAPALKNTNIT